LGVVIFSATACGAEVSEPLYNIDEAKSMTPEVYNIETSSSLLLFPEPQDNTIYTNDFIHTSHRKLALLALQETIGMNPASGEVRNVFPNRPERGILS
jgi:hypothetical protein